MMLAAITSRPVSNGHHAIWSVRGRRIKQVMAGKRQHYVPRLLQRGFLHDHAEGAERTWLHRRGVNARLVGTRDVGVEDWFYSRTSPDDQSTLDGLITDVEGDLSATVNGMRGTLPREVVDPSVAARCLLCGALGHAHRPPAAYDVRGGHEPRERAPVAVHGSVSPRGLVRP